MKNFFSFPDTRSVDKIPQGIQHLIIGDMARQCGGQVTFYSMENTLTLDSHQILISKIHSKPNIDGFIFLTTEQIFKNMNRGTKIMNLLLQNNWEAHFSIEKISLKSKDDLEELFPLLRVKNFTDQRDKNKIYLSKFYQNFVKNTSSAL